MLTKFKFYALGFLLTIIFISCNSEKKETNTRNSELNNKETPPDKKEEITTIDSDSIIKNLQGEWRESEYPFRMAYFKNATVKFTEEGVVEEPTFREFNISQDCPFKTNNIKNASSNDIFLVMAEARTCEILMVFNNTLTLSGYSINTNRDYKIVYNKVE